MGRVQASQLSFGLFCLTAVAVLLRPGEMFPGLEGFPIYESLTFATLATALPRVLALFQLRSLMCQPSTLCLVGMASIIPLSHLTHSYFGGAVEGLVHYFSAAIFYVLLTAVVDRWERFDKLLKVIAIAATVMVTMCVADYLEIIDFPFINHIIDNDGLTATGDVKRIVRMSGSGIFSDPNDISLLMVMVSMVCFSFLTDRSRGPLRIGWLAPMAIFAVGLLCSKSRGGLLSMGAACSVLAMYRYGKTVAITIGVLGILAIPVLAGRQAEASLDDGTGHDRVMLWREGLIAIRSADIVFGTGYRTYHDIAGLMAHNSFVHTFVELGLVGGTFFFGAFFFLGWQLWRLSRPEWPLLDARQQRFLPYMAAIGAGWTIGLQSLSLCYAVQTLMVLGLATAFVNLACWNLNPPRLVLSWDRVARTRMVFASLSVFVGFNVFVMVMTG